MAQDRSTSAERRRRPTLVDVAARTGLSRALVSIVMRGAPGASEISRERVLRAAAELGYRPDARARLLASHSSPLLGVVYSQYGLFHQELLDGLYSAADRAGYDVILSALTAHRDTQRAVDSLIDFRCDAVILLGPARDIPAFGGRLPVVVVGWQKSDPLIDVVRSSDSQGARQAVDHLVELGHRSIAFVDGGRGQVSTTRRRSYRLAMRRHDLGPEIREVAGGLNQEHGVHAALDLLDSQNLPSAVIGYNDEVAAGVLQTMRQAGIAVPQQLSIVGWDDSSLSKLPHLDLTTVRQDQDEIARLAVQRSVERLNDDVRGDRETILPTRLVVRSSTGAGPGSLAGQLR